MQDLGIIHEQILPVLTRYGGLVREVNLRILHHGYISSTVQGGGNRLERNLPLLEKAVVAEPGNTYLLFQLGLAYKGVGRNPHAREVLEKVLARDSGDLSRQDIGDANLRLAQISLSQGRHDDVVRYGEVALGINPGDAVTAYVIAMSWLERGEYQKALSWFLHFRRKARDNLSVAKDLETLITHCVQQLHAPSEN